MPDIAARLAELGLGLPAAPAPLATYLPALLTGPVLLVSGQLPLQDGRLISTGKLGAAVTEAEGVAAARQAFLNVLAQARAALGGDLGRLRRLLRLGGFIACLPGFTGQARVMNGASDLAVQIMGEAGRHVRSTIGVASLPNDAPVEIEAMFEIA